MSERLPLPVEQANKLNENQNKSSLIKKIGSKIVGLFKENSESFNSREQVYKYFSRICGDDEKLCEEYVKEFDKYSSEQGFDYAAQEIINSVLSGDLPRPKGFVNSFALIPIPDFYSVDNAYTNIYESKSNKSCNY
jgi:hypothetical protein